MIDCIPAQRTSPDAVDVPRALQILDIMLMSAQEGYPAEVSTETYRRIVWRQTRQVRGLLLGEHFTPSNWKDE